MTTHNMYEEIAERNSIRRMRDVAFTLVLAATAAFSLTVLGTAGHTVAPAGAVVATPSIVEGCDPSVAC